MKNGTKATKTTAKSARILSPKVNTKKQTVEERTKSAVNASGLNCSPTLGIRVQELKQWATPCLLKKEKYSGVSNDFVRSSTE